MSATSKKWRQILQRILRGWTSRPQPVDPDKIPYPLGLTGAQVDQLRQWVTQSSYRTYSRVLESVGEQLLGEVIAGLNHEQYLAKCGELRMLERLMEMPQRILDKATELEGRHHARL